MFWTHPAPSSAWRQTCDAPRPSHDEEAGSRTSRQEKFRRGELPLRRREFRPSPHVRLRNRKEQQSVELAAIDSGSNFDQADGRRGCDKRFFRRRGARERVSAAGPQYAARRLFGTDAVESAPLIASDVSLDCRSARSETTLLAVATASVRDASNAAQFIEEVERKTVVRVEVSQASRRHA